MSGLSWFLVSGLVAGWLTGVLAKGGWFGAVGDVAIGLVVGGFLLGSGGILARGQPNSMLVATCGGGIMIFLLRVIRKV